MSVHAPLRRLTAQLGIKYNGASGAPAPEAVTDKIFSLTKTLSEYRITDLPKVDISKIGTQTVGPIEIEVVSTTADYVEMLKGIFDFDAIRDYLKSSGATVLFDGMSAVTGPYAKAIFVNELGLDAKKSLMNCDPSPTFNDGHPDPNVSLRPADGLTPQLTYAHELVERVEKEGIDFGAASDGDGDRNMIYGKGAFVTPSDSVAIIAHWAQEAIPYFKNGIKGLARSMPTSAAIDRVAEAQKLDVYEVPTGWKVRRRPEDPADASVLRQSVRRRRCDQAELAGWTPASSASAARSRSARARTTSARRTACGRLWPGSRSSRRRTSRASRVSAASSRPSTPSTAAHSSAGQSTAWFWSWS